MKNGFRLELPLVAAALFLMVSCGSNPTGPQGSTSIPGLSPTGSGRVGEADARWQYECSVTPGFAAPACPVAGATPAIVVADGFFEWIHPNGASVPDWIGVNADATIPGARGDDRPIYTYTYRLAFSLAGFRPETAVIMLEWACDNSFGGWRVNGGSFRDARPEGTQWRTTKPLTITSANAAFVDGNNVLEFRVFGDGLTDGLLVTKLVGAAQPR